MWIASGSGTGEVWKFSKSLDGLLKLCKMVLITQYVLPEDYCKNGIEKGSEAISSLSVESSSLSVSSYR